MFAELNDTYVVIKANLPGKDRNGVKTLPPHMKVDLICLVNF